MSEMQAQSAGAERRDSPPTVVLSLDFEMRWGCYDKLGLDREAYRENLENVREVVPALLKLFSERNIRATWATVGALACQDWEEYFRRAPATPCYEDTALRFSEQYAELDPEGHLHFAPHLVRAIHETPGQELGTHTFSHIFMREPGITAEDVDADLAAVVALWKERFGIEPRSLVFPRNQHSFIERILSTPIRVWRGNETPWYHECTDAGTNKIFPRSLRLLDALNPMVRRASCMDGAMNRASLFFRANLPEALWGLHLSRIRGELKALGPGQIFHLWWHPHNLGADGALRMARVECVLDLIANGCQNGRRVSRSMGDLVH